MSSSLRDAFVAGGVQPTEAQVRERRESEAAEFLAQEAKQLRADSRERQRNKILTELNSVSSVKKFRGLCKKLLMLEPGLIIEVIHIAHARGIHEQPKGGKALIAQLLQTRNALEAKVLSNEDKISIVNYTISKH